MLAREWARFCRKAATFLFSKGKEVLTSDDPLYEIVWSFGHIVDTKGMLIELERIIHPGLSKKDCPRFGNSYVTGLAVPFFTDLAIASGTVVRAAFEPTADVLLRASQAAAGARETANESVVLKKAAFSMYGAIAKADVVQYAKDIEKYNEHVLLHPLRYHVGATYLYDGNVPTRMAKPERGEGLYHGVVIPKSTFAQQRAIAYVRDAPTGNYSGFFRGILRSSTRGPDSSILVAAGNVIQTKWSTVYSCAPSEEDMEALAEKVAELEGDESSSSSSDEEPPPVSSGKEKEKEKEKVKGKSKDKEGGKKRKSKGRKSGK